jgi:hypothetical protein
MSNDENKIKCELGVQAASYTGQWNRRTGRFQIKEIEAILKNKIESFSFLILKGTLYELFP